MYLHGRLFCKTIPHNLSITFEGVLGFAGNPRVAVAYATNSYSDWLSSNFPPSPDQEEAVSVGLHASSADGVFVASCLLSVHM